MIGALALAAVMTMPAGYVPDAECAPCHKGIANSYEHVGMSQSFYRPRPDNTIEDLGKPYYHAKSHQWMELVRRGGRLVFRRWQVDPDNKPINVFEQQVDWILGSGNHARTYLYQLPDGELYQLPLAWYSQTKSWGMAPGYDRADHDGVTRRVRHECLFCHNAYPNAAPDTLSYWRAQTFPKEMPEGTGCQRCHGPGREHARGDINKLFSSIVNPMRLDPQRRNDVCYECHMQPSVSVPGMRVYGRDIYSYRPGQPLADYIVRLDITERELPQSERFEINHHPYRLEQSRCFRESGGKLSCLTCHDPHRNVPPAERAAHYRAACLGCHQEMIAKHQPALDANADCVACHMQPRRTQDVVHVVMTDHFIRRKPGGPELLAPLEERDPNPDGITGSTELYRAAAVVRMTGGANTSAVRKLQELQPTEIEAQLDLAMGLLKQRHYEDVIRTTSSILERDPMNVQAIEWLGLAQFNVGKKEDGIATLRRAIALDASRPEPHFNLGLFLALTARPKEAIAEFERAIALRPNFVAAWFQLGQAHKALNEKKEAIAAWKRTLEIDPNYKRAAAALGE